MFSLPARLLGAALFFAPPIIATLHAAANVSAADHGALPDDGRDDTAALLAAIAECRRVGAGKLVLAPGRYDVSADALPAARRALAFDGFKNFVLEGNGATLSYTGLATALYFDGSEGVTLRNLKIDWARPPFSQGRVLQADGWTFDVEVEPGYPVDGTERFEGIMDYDPDTRLPLANIAVFSNSAIVRTELLRPQVLRITLRAPESGPQRAHYEKALQNLPGRLLVLRHVIYGNYGLDFVNCRDIALEGVDVYAAPGMGLHAQRVENISLLRSGVRIRPGSGRLMSSTADAQYYTHCSGLISIRDSWFEGMGDDAFNACAKFKTITRLTGPASFEAVVEGRSWRGPAPVAGETIEFADARTLATHGRAVVKRGEWNARDKVFRVELETPLPPEVARGDFININTYLPRVRISGSTFTGGAARGLLFSTRDVLVENSRIENHAFAGIMLMAGRRSSFQGPATERVVIRGNTFAGCGGTAIYADASVAEPSPVHRDIVIENNVIDTSSPRTGWHFRQDYPDWTYWNSALCLTAVSDVSVKGNTFSGGPSLIHIDHAARVSLSANRADAELAVCLGSEAKTVTSEGNENFAAPAPRLGLDEAINFIAIHR